MQRDDIEFSFYKEVQEASRVYNNKEIIQHVESKVDLVIPGDQFEMFYISNQATLYQNKISEMLSIRIKGSDMAETRENLLSYYKYITNRLTEVCTVYDGVNYEPLLNLKKLEGNLSDYVFVKIKYVY